jgi:hypothetical protein
MAMLLDRELDLSVVMIAPNRPLLADRRISLEPLLADTYRAVVPAVHPLGALDELDRLSRLAYEPWVLSRHWTSTHEIVMAACAVAGFQPRAAHNTTDFAASVAMVGHGLGVSVIPMLGLPRIVPDTVKILPIRVDPPTRHIAVAVRSGSAQPGSPLAQFRALLKQTVSYLAEPITLAEAVASAIADAEAAEHEDGGPGKSDESAGSAASAESNVPSGTDAPIVLRAPIAPSETSASSAPGESKVGEASAPEDSAPEASAPEASAPEDSVPEVSELVTGEPEDSRPEASEPEDRKPEVEQADADARADEVRAASAGEATPKD